MVLLVTRSLPTLPRQAGPAARRALHGVAGRGARCGMTSRPALLSQLSNHSGAPASCSGPASTTTSLRGTGVRLMSSAKREKVKVLAVLYDGGKHADEVCPTRLSLLSCLALFPVRPVRDASGSLELHWQDSSQELQGCKHSKHPSIGMRGKEPIRWAQ